MTPGCKHAVISHRQLPLPRRRLPPLHAHAASRLRRCGRTRGSSGGMAACVRARLAARRPALRRAATARTPAAVACAHAASAPPVTRVVVLGAGFAGVATAYHLLKLATARGQPLELQLLDAAGVAGGASGVAAGLLHPFAPGKGGAGRLLWRGAEGCAATARLLAVAEAALGRPVAVRAGSLHPQPPPRAPARRGAPPPQEGTAQREGLLTAAQAALRLPGLQLSAEDAAAVMLHADGAVVQPRAYLDGLWAACEAAAASGPAGSSATLSTRRVRSLAELCATSDGGERPHAVVVAAGAAALALPELSSLPLTLCAGAVAHLAPLPGTAPGLPPDAPALLARGAYLAPDGAGGVALGATKEYGVAPESAFSAGELSGAAADAALAELLPRGAALLPRLAADAAFAARRVAWGVRALPPRTPLGALPLLGRLEVKAFAAGAPNVWLFAGLGARGLVYHALLAEQLAAAVLCRDAALLPPELAPPWKTAEDNP